VTGASRGLGLGLVRQFAQEGWRVIATARDPAGAPGLHLAAREHPGAVEIHRLDVAEPDQIADLSDAVGAAPLDVLLNNAGWAARQPSLLETTYDVWEKSMAVNAYATIAMAQTFVQRIARSQHRTIATISSQMGSVTANTTGMRYAYRASKAAANMVVRTLAADLRPRGVIVVSLHPGWVQTALGGPDATLTVEQSASALTSLITGLTPAASGRFLDYTGREIPW
jgi:NAD(P)-dependent dehydrogenase (short-subunit alcohol dehydrogenase family)